MKNMFKRITLELSLKPFKKTDEQFIKSVCREIMQQWRPLLKNRKEIAFMLWVGDGSEILDYDGDLDRAFEWGYFIGTANLPLANDSDDAALSLHEKTRLYVDKPPVMTYRTLKNIIAELKRAAKKAFPNAAVFVGETFDIGPEFAISDFKYKRHPEICSGTALDRLRMVDSTALLNADDYKYAAYPHGIPQNTPFAEFLGAQTKVFFKAMGFDYIWLSNGLGFSANPWSLTGKIFDGERFYADRLAATSKKVFEFWKTFASACPNVKIETRGTNNTAGIDYATDGVPLYDIYKANRGIVPPPNSPWAALNGNYGLEIAGHMSRVCELPGDSFLFRYYIHDPWWMNSPWQDRYDGYASDIYIPMSVARIKEDGSVQTAERLNIFTLDNSRGEMPDSCVNEPLPHILKAEKNCADEPSFAVWLYPLKEYASAKTEEELSEMYFGDRFIEKAINGGMPLNTVVSSDVFVKLPARFFSGRIIISPIVNSEAVLKKLGEFVENGGSVIVYGSRKALEKYPLSGKNVVKIDINSINSPEKLRKSLKNFGYEIEFETTCENAGLPVIATSRSNNATFFSVYSPDTSSDTLIKFPLGAPILSGGEAIIENGYARYRFSRCEHRECRIFIKQNSGVVSCHEQSPVSAKYKRRFYLKGLCGATVYYFPERYCDKFMAATSVPPDETPILDSEWVPFYDEVFGYGFKGKNKNGYLAFLMPFEKYNNK